jgi:hypothetical protein
MDQKAGRITFSAGGWSGQRDHPDSGWRWTPENASAADGLPAARMTQGSIRAPRTRTAILPRRPTIDRVYDAIQGPGHDEAQKSNARRGLAMFVFVGSHSTFFDRFAFSSQFFPIIARVPVARSRKAVGHRFCELRTIRSVPQRGARLRSGRRRALGTQHYARGIPALGPPIAGDKHGCSVRIGQP